MPSATLTTPIKNSLKESEQSKALHSEQKEYPPNWTWKHPNIQDSFFTAITEPLDVEDAHIKMCCHQHSGKDFSLQAEIAQDELKLYLEREVFKDSKEAEKNEELILEARENIIKYKKSKRFHLNAANAYWFWMQCQSDLNSEK